MLYLQRMVRALNGPGRELGDDGDVLWRRFDQRCERFEEPLVRHYSPALVVELQAKTAKEVLIVTRIAFERGWHVKPRDRVKGKYAMDA